jgi:23S rRNA G2445 N2-methylase RlmL
MIASQHRITGLALTDEGCEHACTLELTRLLPNCAPKQGKGCVLFQAKMPEDLLRVAYVGQSMHRVLLHMGTFLAKPTLDQTMTNVSKSLDKKELLAFLKGRTFRVDCLRDGLHDYSSMDIEEETGAAIIKLVGNLKVSMSAPDAIVLIAINGTEGHIGFDLCGKDLSKRHYKIFLHPGTIKGTLAFAMLQEAGFQPGMNLLDPFCGVGTIPIEAALYSHGVSPQHYTPNFAYAKLFSKDTGPLITTWRPSTKDKGVLVGSDKDLRNAKASAKNAKIAGVDKYITFTKIDVEWLDTKFDKKSFDLIVTQPPLESKMTNAKDFDALYKEFFYQAAFILKPKGTICILAHKPERIIAAGLAEKFKSTTKILYQGQQEHTLILMKR